MILSLNNGVLRKVKNMTSKSYNLTKMFEEINGTLMFGKVLNLRFSSVSEAKIAASFCSENFGSKISEYDIIGLNITIGQSGDLNVLFKFNNSDSLKNFERKF